MGHFLAGKPIITIGSKVIRARLTTFYKIAEVGLSSRTVGTAKLTEARDVLSKALQPVRLGDKGVCHQEQLTVLSIDLRGSSQFPVRYDAEDVFVAIQCFLPTMAFLVKHCRGEVLGLRGDGLIAAFGFGDRYWEESINAAYECGMLMLETTREYLVPFLSEKGRAVDLRAGAAIDVGEILITKIGLDDIHEVTAYGAAVNTAAKNAKGENKVWVSAATEKCAGGNGSSARSYSPCERRVREG